MKYFTISELCYSTTAQMQNIDNTAPIDIRVKLTTFVDNCLDPLREAYGKPITVSSGYRCPMLNKAVGGSPTSQHTKGEAADLVGRTDSETRKIFETAKRLGNYDQLLYERNSRGSIWVHISWKISNRRGQCIDNYKAK